MEYFVSTYHHGWISEESQAESYNEAWRNSKKVELVKRFLNENPLVGQQFKKKNEGEEDIFERIVDEEADTDAPPETSRTSSQCYMFELNRKSIATGYYDLWIFEELLERDLIDKYLFGPYYLGKPIKFKKVYNHHAYDSRLWEGELVDL